MSHDQKSDFICFYPDLIIRVNVPNDITVVGICFPLSFPPLVIAATPRVPPSFPEIHIIFTVFMNATMLMFRKMFHLGARSLGGRKAAKLPSSMSGLPQIA